MSPLRHARFAARLSVALLGVLLVLPLRAQLSPHTPSAQTTQLQLPPAPLLPDHFARWQAMSSPSADRTLKLLADPAMNAIANEDGLRRTGASTYTAPGVAGSLSIEALQFGDATGAVASYTFLRQDLQEKAADPARRGNTNIATGGDRAVLREGPSLLVAQSSTGAPLSSSELLALANVLPKLSGPAGLPPLLPTYLPASDLLPRTVEYAVGPSGYKAEGGLLPTELLGFDKAAEVATAQYHGSSTGSGQLTLVLLPTPEIAGARGRALEQWLNASAAADAHMGTVRLRRIGPLLALASNGFTPDQSKALLDSIRLRTEVTWNKPVPPEFHVEVRKTASLLTSIIVFCGVAGLGTLLLGLFLGFGRAWIRVLMGKPAAIEPEFLRLDLRSSPPVQHAEK